MTLEACLLEIEDFRRDAGKRYSQLQMFSMLVISNLCGHFGGRGVARFTRIHKGIFKECLGLKFAPPSYTSFCTFLNNTDETQMINAFNKWTEDFVPLEKGDLVSGDGKGLCSTVSDSNGKNQDFKSVVSLFCHKSGLVYSLASFRNAKASETNVIRFLVNQLQGMGITLFFDALHAQKKL